MSGNNPLALLGLMQKAGKLITGEEQVVKAVQKKKTHLVILAGDASENTAKKITDKCQFYHVPYVIFENRHTIGSAIGKAERVLLAVQDKGFATKFLSLIE